MKETLKQAGYKFINKQDDGTYLLLNLDNNLKEIFVKNKNHASWGIKYKNTHLEFASTWNKANGKN